MLAVAASLARGAFDEHVAEELHFNLLEARAAAAVALADGGVEAEGAGVKATLLREFRRREEFADGGEQPDVGRRIRPRRATDRALVDLDRLVDLL